MQYVLKNLSFQAITHLFAVSVNYCNNFIS